MRISDEIWGSSGGAEAARRRVFSWLTRTGMGIRFGGRPIGWYQQHQVCVLDILEREARGKNYEVRVVGRDRDVQVRRSGEQDWRAAGTVATIYAQADRCVRNNGKLDGFGGGRTATYWVQQPGPYGTTPVPYKSRQEAVEHAQRVRGRVELVEEGKKLRVVADYSRAWMRTPGLGAHDESRFDEPSEPGEDDITTSDHTHWYQYGKLYFTGDEKGLKRKMGKDKFWPNVWFISDHGNAHLITP